MSIFGSDEESIFDTLLLYLYQTIVLATLAAAGFIFYLFRTRAPLKEPREEAEEKVGNGQLADGEFAPSLSDDEILLRSTLLHDELGGSRSPEVPAAFSEAYQPAPAQPYQPPRRKLESEEEEEEEDEGPVPTRHPAIRQMVTTRHGVQEETMTNYPPSFPQNSGYYEPQQFRDPGGYQNPPQGYAVPTPQGYAAPPQFSPPQFAPRSAVSDALKFEAKKRIGHAIQKKQVQELVEGGEFDEAITNIRAASQRLQNSGF